MLRRLSVAILVSIVGGISFAQVHAQTQIQVPAQTQQEVQIPQEILGSSSDASIRPAQKSKNRDLGASLKVETLQYPTEVGGDSRLNQNNMIEGHLRGGWDQGWVNSGLDVAAGQSANLNYQYFAVQEIFSEYRSGSGVYSLGIGRKLEYWNQADRDWNLGLWEPLFQHDGLRMRTQGLTGLFFGVETSQAQLLVFLSPIFVPTMTPDIAERDGEIVSESRWFRSLPSSQSIVGRETQLVYDLQIPAVSELISNPGYGARLRLGGVDEGAWVSAAVALKAVNALSYRYDASVLTQGRLVEPQARAEIELNPIAHRHQITALDFGYRSGGSAVGVSMIQDRPEEKAVQNRVNSKGYQTDYIQQQLKPMTLIAGSASSRISTALPRRLDLRLDVLRAFVDRSVDVDARGQEQSQLIPDRLQFTNAAAVTASSQLWSQVRGSLKYLREFDQRGTLVSFNVDYAPASNWLVNAGLDSLGVDDPEAQKNDSRFLNRYRQNDRVFGGMTYVY